MKLKTIAMFTIGGWGLLHLVGGIVLLSEAAGDAHGALESLGSGIGAVSGDPGPAAESVVRFHAFNIAWIGAVVFGLALAMRKRLTALPLATVTALILFADIGLATFMLAPGTMALTDGLPGITLAAIGLTAAWVDFRRDQSHGHVLVTGQA
jgi:hypothetical protein